MNRSSWVAVACLLSIVTSCRKSDDEDSKAETAVAVRTVLVTAASVTQTIGAFGAVAARSGHIAALSAPAAGRIVRVLVSVGDRVRAGQPLVELDQAPIRAAAQSAATALRAAEQASERANRLAREGIIPRKEAEQAAADLAKARSDAIAASRAAQLSVIRAPDRSMSVRRSRSLLEKARVPKHWESAALRTCRRRSIRLHAVWASGCARPQREDRFASARPSSDKSRPRHIRWRSPYR